MSTHLRTSPLGAELDAAREDATCDVVAHATRPRRTRRHSTVLVTRLPGDPRVEAFRQAMADLFGDRDIEVGP
ncbi:MAG: hypothetical protein Q8S73_36680 [Deltaproteobacteria bacterium]|nr:hypothetical protein [Myxococcales bacterium]MDP3219695.1 hypothetical protein [Deltaproteobacteria bacterium]